MDALRVPTDNPLKVRAVRAACRRFGWGVKVLQTAPPARNAQPRGWVQTIRTASRRARLAGPGGVGIESGIVEIAGFGPFNAVVCAVFDGKRMHLGLGPSFALPHAIAKRARRGELGDVMDRLTGIRLSKRRGGAIAHLTRGKLGRAELLEQAVLMAFASLERLCLAYPFQPC